MLRVIVPSVVKTTTVPKIGTVVVVGMEAICPYCKGQITLDHLPIRHECKKLPMVAKVVKTIIMHDGLVVMVGQRSEIVKMAQGVEAMYGIKNTILISPLRSE
jgi:hypothetical protein